MQLLLQRAPRLRSAGTGVEHWWIQRVTAVALIPLTLWFVTSLIASSGSDYNAVTAWLGTPFGTIFMVLLLIMLFQHMALGLQVVIEDYVHLNRVKVPTVVAIRCVCSGLAVAGIIATLHIAVDRWRFEPGDSETRRAEGMLEVRLQPISKASTHGSGDQQGFLFKDADEIK